MIKRAVIVAAGLSSRLYPLTLERPKGLLKVNEQELLLRSIDMLESVGVDEIYVIVGYRKNDIEQIVKGKATCIFNPFYRYCNNMGSLSFAKFVVHNEPFLYLHGDIIYSEELLTNFLKQSKGSGTAIDLAVDFKETVEEDMKVKVTVDNQLIESSKELLQEESAGEWIGLARINMPEILFAYIDEALAEEHYNVYDTFAFSRIAADSIQITCYATEGEPWIEIDFIEDYERAKELFE